MPNPSEKLPAILVVDDDRIFAVAIERHLRPLIQGRYEVVFVDDGNRALAVLEQRVVPLLITDYYLLTSINGLKIAAAIRERSPGTRVVLMTAYATPEIEEAAAAEGVEFYLPKPFLLEDLEPIARKVLTLS
jgi:two-component system, response regulator, stage 0 sporulation protein F